jgi:hypothetical protein
VGSLIVLPPMTFVSLPLSPGAVEAGLVLFCAAMFCFVAYGCFGCLWIFSKWMWPSKTTPQETVPLVGGLRVVADQPEDQTTEVDVKGDL